MPTTLEAPRAVVRAGPVPGSDVVLTPEALTLVAELARAFTPRVRELLARRRERQRGYDAGRLPDFDPDTAWIRAGAWTCAPLPPDLVDRRVEITGPPDPRRTLHALGSGASAFMADFEDALAPTFPHLVLGQATLREAARRTLTAEASDGRSLRVPERPAVLMARPRGWHLWETNVQVDHQPVPAALFDAALYVFHNARELLRRGSGAYLYLPKMEDAGEAALWADVLERLRERCGLPHGSIRVTVLIETFPTLFAMDEILHALRDTAAGLNLGRWDLLFSRIKVTAEDPSALLPDREAVDMHQPFLQAATRLLVSTCHRRGVLAMGGMAADIPRKDAVENASALARVRADKEREVQAGHDGTWVAHPALVPVAKAIFDAHVRGPNQLTLHRDRVDVRAVALQEMPRGPRTWGGTLRAADVALRYLAAWLGGVGCVALDGRMEDAATAEIARTMLWQRVRHRARLEDGSLVDATRLHVALDGLVEAALEGVADGSAEAARVHEARALLERMTTSPRCPDFLTTSALERLHPATPTPLEA